MTVLSMRRPTSATPQTGRDARLAIRTDQFTGQTAGVAPGYVQGNLAILPRELAGDFLRFCQLNPKPCPVLGVSSPGDFRLPTLADDLDISREPPEPPPTGWVANETPQRVDVATAEAPVVLCALDFSIRGIWAVRDGDLHRHLYHGCRRLADAKRLLKRTIRSRLGRRKAGDA